MKTILKSWKGDFLAVQMILQQQPLKKKSETINARMQKEDVSLIILKLQANQQVSEVAVQLWSLSCLRMHSILKKAYFWTEHIGHCKCYKIKGSYYCPSPTSCEREVLIESAQKQALNTRLIETGVQHTRDDTGHRLQRCPKANTANNIGIQDAGRYCIFGALKPGGWYTGSVLSTGWISQRKKMEASPKVIENGQITILSVFQIQTNKMGVANQQTKQVNKAVEETCSNPKIKQGLKDEWGEKKNKSVGSDSGGQEHSGCDNTKLAEWLEQNPGTTTEICVQKREIQGTAKIFTEASGSLASIRRPKFEGGTRLPTNDKWGI